MQRNKYIFAAALLLCLKTMPVLAEFKNVEASACDEKQGDFDAKTMEYRAVDKASLIAVKSAGVIQKNNNSLPPAVVDIIAYRLIDEYLQDVKHEITLSEPNRICVKMQATLDIDDKELSALVEEHKQAAEPAQINPDAETKMAEEVAEEIKNKTAFKPQNLKEKKLLYIDDMKFWDKTKNNHYTDWLKEQFSHSDYYYVTDNKELADFLVTPSLNKAMVDKIDKTNRKMQMVIELRTDASFESDFIPIQQEQTHFILFGADKDEQQIADTLIKKLLTKAVADADKKINKYLQDKLEKNVLKDKK